MKLRIFRVAKELQLDGMEFFRYAQMAGLKFDEKSMFGRITSAQRDTLVEFLKRTGRLNPPEEESE
jgi:hypothetical protein